MSVVNSTEAQQPGASDRRQFRRFPMFLRVTAQRDVLAQATDKEGAERPERTIHLQVQDFSLSGLRGECAVALRQGEPVTVSMPPYGTRPEIGVTGRVARCQRQGGRFDVGIEFCQTHEAPESSPWLRIHEIFYFAGQTAKEIQ